MSKKFFGILWIITLGSLINAGAAYQQPDEQSASTSHTCRFLDQDDSSDVDRALQEIKSEHTRKQVIELAHDLIVNFFSQEDCHSRSYLIRKMAGIKDLDQAIKLTNVLQAKAHLNAKEYANLLSIVATPKKQDRTDPVWFTIRLQRETHFLKGQPCQVLLAIQEIPQCLREEYIVSAHKLMKAVNNKCIFSTLLRTIGCIRENPNQAFALSFRAAITKGFSGIDLVDFLRSIGNTSVDKRVEVADILSFFIENRFESSHFQFAEKLLQIPEYIRKKILEYSMPWARTNLENPINLWLAVQHFNPSTKVGIQDLLHRLLLKKKQIEEELHGLKNEQAKPFQKHLLELCQTPAHRIPLPGLFLMIESPKEDVISSIKYPSEQPLLSKDDKIFWLRYYAAYKPEYITD